MSVLSKKRSARKRRLESQVPLPIDTTVGIVPSRYFGWKGLLDRSVAVLLLLPGLPMIGLLVLLMRLTSRGPGLFRQSRVGKDGHVFVMFKIRTMRDHAEAGTGPVWTQTGDPRVTRLGRLLRKLHLDELPQLFNVLRGEMSLIGPRPERPEFVRLLAAEIPDYTQRLKVLPGVTGLAQINLPPDTDFDSVRRKLVLDLEYIERASLLLDVRMFLCTFVRLVGLPGNLVMRGFRLERTVTLTTDGTRLPSPNGGKPQSNDTTLASLLGQHAECGGNGSADSRNGNGHANHSPACHVKPR